MQMKNNFTDNKESASSGYPGYTQMGLVTSGCSGLSPYSRYTQMGLVTSGCSGFSPCSRYTETFFYYSLMQRLLSKFSSTQQRDIWF